MDIAVKACFVLSVLGELRDLAHDGAERGRGVLEVLHAPDHVREDQDELRPVELVVRHYHSSKYIIQLQMEVMSTQPLHSIEQLTCKTR